MTRRAAAKLEEAVAEPARRRDAERTRTALMKAALKDFSQHGFAGARIERIAKSADCNIRMMYHYFGDKRGLYVAVLEAAYADLRHQEAQLHLDTATPTASLLQLLRFTFLYFQSNPMFEGLLRAENMMRGKFVSQSKPVPEGAFPLKQAITELITNGQAKGELRDGLDAVQLYVTIVALSRFHISNAFSMSAVLGEDLRDKAWRSARLQHCLDVFAAYLARPAAT